MNRKVRNGLIIALAAGAFVAWVVVYNLYPPAPRLPHWFKLPGGARQEALVNLRGAGGGEVFTRMIYPGKCEAVVDGIMKDCKDHGYVPAWDPAHPAAIDEKHRRMRADRLRRLETRYEAPSGAGIFAFAQHSAAEQAGVVVFAWPAPKAAPTDKDQTLVDLFFTGGY